MNIDTFPPQSSVTSRPLIPLVVPELDVYGLPPKYQSYYIPDAYFPVPRSPSPTTPGRHSSSFQGLPDLNSTPYALENSGTYRAGEIAQLQPTSVAMSNPDAAPFLSQRPSDPPTRPTIYARMATPATQQRTKQACDSCRERKTKVRQLSPDLYDQAEIVARSCPCSVLASALYVSAAPLAASSAIMQPHETEIASCGIYLESVITAVTHWPNALLRSTTLSTRRFSLCPWPTLSLLPVPSGHRSPLLVSVPFLRQPFVRDGLHQSIQFPTMPPIVNIRMRRRPLD
jgi:hypothetical protein